MDSPNQTLLWIFAAIILGGVLLWTLLIFWFQDIGSAGEQWISEGREFGESTTSQGCIDKALALDDECSGVTCSIQNNVFLSACLDTSQQVKGFCDQVPDSGAVIQAALWEVNQCNQVGKTSQSCHQLFRAVHNHCTKIREIDRQARSLTAG